MFPWLARALWSCVQCRAPYDIDEIEQFLIDVLQRKSMAYTLQDLKCVKCKAVSCQSSEVE